MKLNITTFRFNKIFILKGILKFLPEKIIVLFLLYAFTMNVKGSEQESSSLSGDTILFSGYRWVAKDSYGKHTGPGNNYFSRSKDNVYLDAEGKLHLRITHRNEKWYCPEVRLIKNLGRGTYYFYLDPLPQPLDKDIVIGLFLYDREDTSYFHKEIDIEISQWGKDTSVNTQYVIQPKEDDAYRFQTDLSIGTKHTIELNKKRINFKSYYGIPDSNDIPLEYSNHVFERDYKYVLSTERISINVWLNHTSEPSNLKEFEVIISKFDFKPFWYDKFFKFLKKNE